jgi:hypothetical protein
MMYLNTVLSPLEQSNPSVIINNTSQWLKKEDIINLSLLNKNIRKIVQEQFSKPLNNEKELPKITTFEKLREEKEQDLRNISQEILSNPPESTSIAKMFEMQLLFNDLYELNRLREVFIKEKELQCAAMFKLGHLV